MMLWKWKIGFLATALLIVQPGITYAADQSAQAGGVHLPVGKDQPLDIKLPGNDGVKRKQPALRGAEHFEIKWRVEMDQVSNLVADQAGDMYFVDINNVVHAIFENGEEKWTYNLETTGLRGFPELYMGKDGVLYVLIEGVEREQDSRLQANKPGIVALSREGKQQWKLEVPNLVSIADVYFDVDEFGSVTALTDGGIIGISPAGEIRWTNKQIAKSVLTKYRDSIITENNILKIRRDNQGNSYVTTKDHHIYGIDRGGKLLWQKKLVNDYQDFYVAKSGMIVLLSSSGARLLDGRDGTVQDNNDWLDQQKIDDLGIPNDGEGGIYLNFDTNGILDVDKSGRVKWEYRTGPKNQLDLYDVSSDRQGNVYFSNTAGNLYSLDKYGKERFVLVRDNDLFTSSSIVIGHNGNMYCLTEDLGLISLGKKEIQVFLDNRGMYLSRLPIDAGDKVFVPLKAIFEKMGWKVEWDDGTRVVTMRRDKQTVRLSTDTPSAEINGRPVTLSDKPRVIAGTTFVAHDFISLATEGKAKVEWDAKTKNVQIWTKNN